MRTALVVALLAGGSFLVPWAICWIRQIRWGLPVRVTVDPDNPRPADICGYLAEVARRLDERPERMRIRFDGRNTAGRAILLDIDTDRRLRISVEGHRPQAQDLRGRWIPDHEVPLNLRRAVLYVEPVDANRFRVMSRIPFSVSPFLYVSCSLLATLGVVFVLPELVSVAAGFALGCATVSAHSR